MLTDLNTSSPPSDPSPLRVAGGVGYFSAFRSDTGRELWRTDATAAGTQMVTELAPGAASVNPSPLQALGGQMLFLSGPSNPAQLWKTDGTAAGTSQVATIPGTIVSTTATATQAFFVVQGSGTAELWTSDGTATGTSKLINLSSTGASLAAAGSNVFFTNADSQGTELWMTNGAVAGTARLKDIRVGTVSSSPSQLTAVGNTLFFTASDGINGVELWKSDGTAAGTALVTNLEAGNLGASLSWFTAGASRLYFVYKNNVWRTDGTAAGTFVLSDLTLSTNNSLAASGDTLYVGVLGTTPQIWRSNGLAGSMSMIYALPGTGWYHAPYNMTAIGNRVFFREDTWQQTDALYVTDGTPAGSGPVMNWPLLPTAGAALANLNGVAVFPAKATNTGEAELFRSDGTPAGTTRMKDINDTPTGSSSPMNVTTVGNRTFFWAIATDPVTKLSSLAMCVTDGTEAGTKRLLRTSVIEQGSIHESPIVAWRGKAYFMSDSDGKGRELWESDGTADGTRIVADISPGSAATMIEMLYPGSDYLYFAATTSGQGRELWRTDGTAQGTTIVKDIRPGSGSGISFDRYNPWNFIEWRGGLYFYATDPSNVTRLYRTDGTDAGTVPLSVMTADVYFTRTNYIVANDHLFIRSSAYPNQDSELWVTDGTPAGTTMLKDIYPGPTASQPSELTVFNDRLFFTADSPEYGRELWTSDGTPEGTRLFKDINPGTAAGGVNRLALSGDGRMYFAANDGVRGNEWWVSDGTPGGTRMIADVNPGAGGSVSVVRGFAYQVVGGVLVYIAYTPGNDEELWRSDGTPEGTYMLHDMAPGLATDIDYNSYYMGESQGVLYYNLITRAYGGEVWRTDGTPAGTRMVADIAPGASTSYPRYLVRSGTDALFVAESAAYGAEFWRITDDAGPTITTVQYQFHPATPRVLVRFNEPVGTSFTPADLHVTNLATGQPVPIAAGGVTYDAAAGRVVIDARDAAGRPWADGTYRLSLASGSVTDLAGSPIAAGAAVDFVVKAALPAWLAGGSAATWDPVTKALVVTGAATITAEPGPDSPVVSVSGAAARLTIDAPAGGQVTLGGLRLWNNASAVLSAAGAGRVLVIADGADLWLDPTGVLDLGDNALVVHNASQSAVSAGHAAVTGRVRSAFNEFAWNGKGITSSTAAADVAGGTPSTLGILLNNDGGGNALFYGPGTEQPTFMGAAVDASTVMVGFTRLGDGDLNGVVNSVDFALFQAGYTGAAPYVGFAFGDYDYNGVIDSVDFGLFQAGYQVAGPTGGAASGEEEDETRATVSSPLQELI